MAKSFIFSSLMIVLNEENHLNKRKSTTSILPDFSLPSFNKNLNMVTSLKDNSPRATPNVIAANNTDAQYMLIICYYNLNLDIV